MASIREYDYKYKEDNVELEALVSNESTAPVPDSYHELTEHCHIILWNQYPQKIKKFIEWIEETTEAEVENIWGVLYNDGGGVKWHAHNSEKDIKYSFVYYIKVPPNSSAIYFAKDPSKEETWMEYPIVEGHCLVWDKELPHSVPPNNHSGRCVISGNLK